MPTSKGCVPFGPLQTGLFQPAAGFEDESVFAEDAAVQMELAERADDGVADVDLFAANDARGRGRADGRGVVVEA